MVVGFVLAATISPDSVVDDMSACVVSSVQFQRRESVEANIKNDLLNRYITPVLTVSSGEVYK